MGGKKSTEYKISQQIAIILNHEIMCDSTVITAIIPHHWLSCWKLIVIILEGYLEGHRAYLGYITGKAGGRKTEQAILVMRYEFCTISGKTSLIKLETPVL